MIYEFRYIVSFEFLKVKQINNNKKKIIRF